MTGKYYICRGIGSDKFLWILPEDQLEILQEKIEEGIKLKDKAARSFLRRFRSSVNELVLDKQNRIMIPPKLQAYAEIADRKITYLGDRDRIEIWDAAKWKAIDEEGDDFNEEAQIACEDFGF